MSVVDAKKAGAGVVDKVEHPLLSALLYPGLQALDEEHLNVDVQLGGIELKELFTFSEKYLPKLGYRRRIHLMTPILPGVDGLGKMSSSVEDNKIELLDTSSSVQKKLKKAFCESGKIDKNSVLAIAKLIIFRSLQLQNNTEFIVLRDDANGGTLTFESYTELEKSFQQQELHPLDLKLAVQRYLNVLLDPIRDIFNEPKLTKLIKDAYPIPIKKNVEAELSPHRLDMRIGKVIEVSRHPGADNLYVEKIDLGEEGPRTIVSGLVDYVPEDQMLNRMVVVLCNMKVSKMRGIESAGMVLCASRKDSEGNDIVEPLFPPPGSKCGDKVLVEGYETGLPDEVLNPKKKIWDKLQVDLKVDSNLEASWKSNHLFSKSGKLSVTNSLLKDAPIK